MSAGLTHGAEGGSPDRVGVAEVGLSPDQTRLILELTRSFAFVVEIEPDGTPHLVWTSDFFTRELGYTTEEVEAMGGPLQIIHRDDVALAHVMIEGIQRGAIEPGPPLRLHTKAGEVRWIRLRYRAEPTVSTDINARVFGVGQDVSQEIESREQAAANAATLESIFEHSPIGQSIVSSAGVVLAANPAYCDITGYRADEIVDNHFDLVVQPRLRERARERLLQSIVQSGTRHDFNARWRRKDGKGIDVDLCVMPIRDDGGTVRQLVTAVQDVTEQTRARTDLERLAAIVVSSADAIESVTPHGSVLSWNPGAERLYGYTSEEMVGATLASIVPTDRQAELLRLLDQAASGQPVVEHVTQRIHKDGTRLDILLSMSPIHDGAGAVVAVSVLARDVTQTERVAAELRSVDEQRRVLLERLVDTQRDERVRMSRELHDGLGQILTSAALFARSLEEEAGEPFAAPVASLRTLIEDALAATRTLVWRLRPVEVEELGLALAIQKLAEKFRQRHGLLVAIHLAGVDHLAPPVEATMYRVIQEAMTNAVKHGAPTTLSVVATRRDSRITVVVEDDGCGFDSEQELTAGSPARGAGITGMRERAEALGGELAVESRPGRGTMVRLVVPPQAIGGA